MVEQMSDLLKRLGYIPALSGSGSMTPTIQQQRASLDTVIVSVKTSTKDLSAKLEELEKTITAK